MSVAAGIETTQDVATGLATIEGIDLDLEVQCAIAGQPWCPADPHRADLVIRERGCPKCGKGRETAPICADSWARLGERPMRTKCCAVRLTRDEALEIVQWLRGRR